jgi:glutamyl-tRNA reductase
MNIYITEINYRTTPLEFREKLSFSADEQKQAVKTIFQLEDVAECVLLSTCNRTEVYIYTTSEAFEIDLIQESLCRMKGLDIRKFKKYFNVFHGSKAVQHLFKVACGLDSMVLGEDQILGQVKNAHEIAINSGTSSSVLNTLFRDVITAAKKAKSQTGISKNPVSIGSLIIKMLMELYPDQFKDKCFLLIGTGKIGTVALKNLLDKDIKKVYVTNRTHGKVEDLSKIYKKIKVIDYQSRYSIMDQCDIIISATMSPHYTITRDLLEKAISKPKERVFIDLAVPRDIDTAIKDLPGVQYFSIDDLRVVAERNIDKRKLEIASVDKIICQYLAQYEKWYQFRDFLPLLQEVQNYSQSVVKERIDQALQKLKHLSPAEKEIVVNALIGISDEILNKFIYSIREYGSHDDIKHYFGCLKNVFDKRKEEQTGKDDTVGINGSN